MRILICGSRTWSDTGEITRLLWKFGDRRDGNVVVHGGAEGADKLGAHVAESHYGLKTEEFKADWDRHGKSAGPIRNQQMLDSGFDHALAFIDLNNDGPGTRDMLERLIKAGVPIEIRSKRIEVVDPQSVLFRCE